MGLYLRSTFIVSYSPYPLDLRQSKKSSFILCSIKTHKASIALQVLFLIGSLVVTIFQPLAPRYIVWVNLNHQFSVSR